MSVAAAVPYDLLAGELRALTHSEGAALWSDRRRLVALLLDHQPDLRREIRAIGTAVDEGVATALLHCQRQLAGIAIDRQAQLVETEAGLRPDVARGVTRAIAHALDLGPLPGVYRDAGAAEPEPPSRQQHAPHVPSVPPAPVIGYPAPPPAPPRGVPASGLAAIGAAVLIGAVVLFTGLPGGRAPQGEQAQRNYGDELTDWGVAAQPALQSNVGSATPLAVPVGKRVTTDEVRTQLAARPATLLLDVLANPHPQTLQGARYVPRGGLPGAFTDAAQSELKATLARLSGGDAGRPLIFFCAGARCWESYNAALRAAQLGYRDIAWYRGGLQSWEQAGLPMQALPPAER